MPPTAMPTNGARKMRTTLQERKGHREAIFTDTVLREMGLDLPMSLDEMKTIPGIRPEMVDLYGKQFLTLVNNSREFYGDDTPVPRNPQLRNRRPQQSRITLVSSRTKTLQTLTTDIHNSVAARLRLPKRPRHQQQEVDLKPMDLGIRRRARPARGLLVALTKVSVA